MTETRLISLAQVNPTVGAIAANQQLVMTYYDQAKTAGSDLVIFPEMVLVGYPAEDLVRKKAFTNKALKAIEELAIATKAGPAMIVGAPYRDGEKLYNTSFLIADGEIAVKRYKYHLPNYGVFDEKRVFDAGPLPEPVDFMGMRLGMMTCEDMWFPDVSEHLAAAGADVLIAPHGSPYQIQKLDERVLHARKRVDETKLPLIMNNLIGGQDELVFDGASFVLNCQAVTVAQMPAFEEHLTHTQWSKKDGKWCPEDGEKAALLSGDAELYQALMLALRDYVNKNRFPGVLVGLSGGVDSALTVALAVDALGADRVHSVMMPSRYTSQESLDDARDCADALSIRLDSIAIEPMVAAFDAALSPLFEGLDPDTTEENIQARIRGINLMALSNKFGHMVVATGNKSEFSVGYSTLYGDLCGGFAALKDLYKVKVFDLCRWRNEYQPVGGLGPAGVVIPDNIISKPPTAELREDQKDEDSLPPYEVLDAILTALVEDDLSVAEIVDQGFDPATVKRIEHLLYIAEYKRRQAPPGVKLTRRQFNRDRRYPITNGFRDA